MNQVCAIAVALFFIGPARAADLPETSMAAYPACEAGIKQWAEQFHPISIHTEIIRPEQVTPQGKRIELYVQVVYDTQGGQETRQANIECRVDARGAVAVAELSR
jgi:hypothetical protein